MKEEYLNRTQRAEEDVQSYVSEKTELFRAAFPHASQREWSRCWMETAEGLCNQYVRDRMMASESRDTEDFVQQAVRAMQAEQAWIRIGDSTEGRDGLEPVSWQIRAGKEEKAKQRSQRRSPAGEESGRLQRERSVQRNPPAGEVYELRRVRRESEEAPSPPLAGTPRGGGGVAAAERAREAPPPPAPSPGSEGEEEAIARYVFSIPAEEYRPSTSAYVRVKVFKKTIIAKMLIDSGNLVSDLIFSRPRGAPVRARKEEGGHGC